MVVDYTKDIHQESLSTFLEELRSALHQELAETNPNKKKRYFEHLLFNANASSRILSVDEFVDEMV